MELFKYVVLLVSIDLVNQNDWTKQPRASSPFCMLKIFNCCRYLNSSPKSTKGSRSFYPWSDIFFSLLLKGWRTFPFFQLCYLPSWSLYFLLFSWENHHLEASTSMTLQPFTVRQEPALNIQDFYFCMLRVTKIRLKVLSSEICLVRITPEDVAWVKASCSKWLTGRSRVPIIGHLWTERAAVGPNIYRKPYFSQTQ